MMYDNQQMPEKIRRAVDNLRLAAVPTEAHFAMARRVLDRESPSERYPPHYEQVLGRELWVQWRCLIATVDSGGVAADAQGFPADLHAAGFFSRLGTTGKRLAEKLTEGAHRRQRECRGNPAGLWAAWGSGEGNASGSPIFSNLAKACWLDTVKPRLDAASMPAISYSVLHAAVDGLWGKPGTLAQHRLFRFLIHRAYEQACTSAPGPIVLHGGYQALAQELGLKPGSQAAAAREAVATLVAHQGKVGRDCEHWLEAGQVPAAPGRSACLTLTPSPMLAPFYVNQLPKRTTAQRRARYLVPVPLDLPPLVGRGNDHAAQCALQSLVLAEFRLQAAMLSGQGMILIPRSQWATMAKQAGLPMTMLPSVLQRWCSSEGGFLVAMGDEGFALGPQCRCSASFILCSQKQG